MKRTIVTLVCFISSAFVSSTVAQVEQNDLILGASEGSELSLELMRGTPTESGGGHVGNFWDKWFIQSVAFDNLNGISHNPAGNLIGVNFGRSPNDDGTGGGSITSLATCGDARPLPNQDIGDSNGLGGSGLTQTRMAGLSISPDNSRLAVGGYDSARVLVFDYAASDCSGTGASLSNGRESEEILTPGRTQSTVWLDNDSLVVLKADGNLLKVDANTLESELVAELPVGEETQYNSLAYHPDISPYLFVSTGVFSDGTTNTLFVLDAVNGFDDAATLDLSESLDTAREIALDSEGNLYLGQFGGAIDVLPAFTNPDALEDNSSLDWFATDKVSPTFSGLDVAHGVPFSNLGPTTDGDFNMDGAVDPQDIDLLTQEVIAGTNRSEFDVDGNGVVDQADRISWVVDVRGSYIGDSNDDGEFGSGDFVFVFQAGEYEDGVAENSTWATGDWNGDLEFDTADFVFAFQEGGYELGPRAAQAVPEPAGITLLGISLLMLLGRQRSQVFRR